MEEATKQEISESCRKTHQVIVLNLGLAVLMVTLNESKDGITLSRPRKVCVSESREATFLLGYRTCFGTVEVIDITDSNFSKDGDFHFCLSTRDVVTLSVSIDDSPTGLIQDLEHRNRNVGEDDS